jgi:tripartite-type tricarboxylate transporter receptor subunit TctC
MAGLVVGAIGAAASLAFALLQSGEASTTGPFYEDKNLTYIVATSPGGGYDAYARHIGRYLQKYLPADNVIIRNVPGAGHIVGANTLWRARPNGLVIGTFNVGLVYGQLIGKEAQQFDLRDFEWIGKAAGEPRAVVVSNNCAIKSMQDLMAAEEPVIFGSAGVGSASYSDTMLLADALDLNIKVVPGFDGTEGEMSMMRGEICAVLGSISSFQNFIDGGNGFYLVTIGGTMPGVPNAMEFATTERARRLIGVIDALAQLGRATAAPPGTPKERLEALRAAYRAALEDPQFLAEARRMNMPIEPAFGEDVRQLIVEALDQSPETVAMIATAIGGGS